MLQDKLSQLQEETTAFITGRVGALGLTEPGNLLNVKVEIRLTPLPPVRAEIKMAKSKKPRARKGCRPSLNRPLTDGEWTRLLSLSYSSGLRKILEFFAANGNNGVKGKVLVEAGVLDQYSKPLSQFNLFLHKHGVPCCIRKMNPSQRHTMWYDAEYRIFALGEAIPK